MSMPTLDTGFLRARFHTDVTAMLERGGVSTVVVGDETGIPSRPVRNTGIMLVPFLMVCVEGHFHVLIMRNGVLSAMRLPARSALF